MNTSEIISNKIEQLLGDNYKVFPISHFNKNFTEARECIENGNIGYVRLPNSDYGTFRKNRVVGVLTLGTPSRANADIFYLSSTYNIDFSVPRNIEVTNKYGDLTKENAFNFNEDIDALINTTINNNIEFEDDYKGRITISEPTYLLNETDGEFTYDIMRVTGQIVISDKASFGGDYKVEFNIDGEYVELDSVNSYNEVLTTDGNAIARQGQAKIEQNLAQSGWACTFSIDDYLSENKARLKLYDIIHNNLEIINPNADSEALKRKLPVRTTTPSGSSREFNAIVGITFSTTRNGVGTYDISLTDDNRR